MIEAEKIEQASKLSRQAADLQRQWQENISA